MLRPRRLPRSILPAEGSDVVVEPEKVDTPSGSIGRRVRTRRADKIEAVVEPFDFQDPEPPEEFEPEEIEVESKPVIKRERKERERSKTIRKVGEPIPAGPEPPINTNILSNLPATLNMQLDGQRMLDMMGLMDNGMAFIIHRISDDQWRIAISRETVMVTAGQTFRGRAFYEEVCTPEYLAWKDEWDTLSTEEKIKSAVDAKLKWTRSDALNIDVMRAGMAMVEHLKLTKYKPQYQSNAARESVRG